MSSIDELFQRKLPILLKSPDREERKSCVQVAVEVHSTATPNHRRDLVIRLTDESDLFFLYTLKLAEEDFQSLKTQQGLLVDFAAFPQKFIDLLQLCLQEEHKEMPKFVLHLMSNGASGTTTANLNVIETNPFKHLTHLSLKFLPGTDGDVKKYLAHCLKTLKDHNQLLLERLEHTETDLSQQLRQAREALANRTQELDSLKSEWTRKSSDMSSKHVQDVNSERERAIQAQMSAQQRLEREKKEQEQAHTRVVKMMEVKVYDLETGNKTLTDNKYKSEAMIREIKSKLSLLEEEHLRSKQEVQSLRKENSGLDQSYHEQEKLANQLRTRLAVVEQEVKDKEEVMKRTSDQLLTEQDHKRKTEEDVEKKKKHIGKCEGSIKKMSEDVIKGNEIIKKLQGEIKHYHSKLKLRNQVTTEQEKLLVEKNKEMEEIRRELEQIKTQHRQKEEENKKLNESLESTMAKLEESRQLLKTNENVINWLNKQVTESQLSGQRPGHGPFEMTSSSVSSFKPSTGQHNFSAPSVSALSGPSTHSRGATPVNGVSPTAASLPPKHPQVHFNPNQPKKSVLPVPIAKSSPIGSIPEERRPDEAQTSPPQLHNKPTQKPPFLDAKYLQPHEIPLRGASSVPRTISPTPLRFTSHAPISVAASSHNPNRLSKDIVTSRPPGSSTSNNTKQPPLASAYFPGQTKVS